MATNMYCKFTGPDINAGSTSKGHEGWIEVLSWSHSWTQPTTATRSHGGGGTVEKAHHAPFQFTKSIDSATDDLLKMCWSGKHIDKMEFACYRDDGTEGNGTPYLKVELESVIVTDYSMSGGVGDVPHESVSLNYAKVTYTYNGQDKLKGTVGADQPVSHDIATNVVA